MQSPSDVINKISREYKEQVNKVAVKLAELYDHQTTVRDLLDDEEDNDASIETRALSVINNKIIHQTCTWVRLNACFCIKTTTHSCAFLQLQTEWTDKFNCSSAIELKRAMVKLQIWISSISLKQSLDSFPSNNNEGIPRCNWTRCNIPSSGNSTAIFNHTLSALQC